MVDEVFGPGVAGSAEPPTGSGVGKNREVPAGSDALTVLREVGELLAGSVAGRVDLGRSSSVVVCANRYSELAARCRLAAAGLEAVMVAAARRPSRMLPDAYQGFRAGFSAGQARGQREEAEARGGDPDAPWPADFETALAVFRAQIAKGMVPETRDPS